MINGSKLGGATKISAPLRLGFALLSIVLVWMLFAAVVAVGSLEFGWEFVPLVGWIAIFAAVTFALFVLPLLCLTSAAWQLRYWYVLLAFSLCWAIGLGSLFFHTSPIRMLADEVFGYALVVSAIFTVSLYVVLLRLRLSRRPALLVPGSAGKNAHF